MIRLNENFFSWDLEKNNIRVFEFTLTFYISLLIDFDIATQLSFLKLKEATLILSSLTLKA